MARGACTNVVQRTAPAEGSEGLSVAPLARSDVQEATQQGVALTLVDGGTEGEHQGQLHPEAAGAGGVVRSAVTPSATRGWLVIPGVDGSDGAEVCEINLAVAPLPSEWLLEVLRTPV
ncbi:unnamed protein product, partial [Ectocarpus sp. 12 AP-2014]